MPTELDKYIVSSREQKVPDSDIKAQLIKSGWGEAEVDKGLAVSPAGDFLPPPPVPRFGMWVAFQYIILFISLYISATSFAGILHQIVNDKITDSLDNIGYSYAATFNDSLVRVYIAALIVAFPIFLVLFLILKRQVLQKPIVKSLKARKVLIYLTLVGTFLIMLGHLIMEIYGLLSGTTTTRSLAHLGVTLLVAGSIFIYFIFEVKEDRKHI